LRSRRDEEVLKALVVAFIVLYLALASFAKKQVKQILKQAFKYHVSLPAQQHRHAFGC